MLKSESLKMTQPSDTRKLSSILSAKFIESFRELEHKQEFVHQISEAISKLVIGNQNEQYEGALQLLEAIQSQDEELVKYLVQTNSSDPNSRLPTGQNPIHLVAVQMREKACAMLIALSSSSEHPLNLNVQNTDGNTAKHIAATLASEDLLSLLLKKNADPNIQNMTGNTPLHIACKMNAPKIAKQLIQESSKQRPLNLNLQNDEGNTPMYIASNLANEENVSQLLENDADPNIQNMEGDTSLHIASKKTEPKITKALLRYPRTDITLKNKEGKAPNQLNISPEVQAVITSACLSRSNAALGKLEIALSWNNRNNLNIYVTCPHEEVICFLNKKSSCCNGTLDIDMNVNGESEQPVKHICWRGEPPRGRYIVHVHHFAVHTSPPQVPTEFYVRITVDQVIVWETRETVHNVKNGVHIISFTYPDDTNLDSSSRCKLNGLVHGKRLEYAGADWSTLLSKWRPFSTGMLSEAMP